MKEHEGFDFRCGLYIELYVDFYCSIGWKGINSKI